MVVNIPSALQADLAVKLSRVDLHPHPFEEAPSFLTEEGPPVLKNACRSSWLRRPSHYTIWTRFGRVRRRTMLYYGMGWGSADAKGLTTFDEQLQLGGSSLLLSKSGGQKRYQNMSLLCSPVFPLEHSYLRYCCTHT